MSGRRNTLFLMELIVVIAFFALCAALCAQAFGTAKRVSDRAAALSGAVQAAESGAACWKQTGGDPGAAAALLGGTSAGDTVTVYYDAEWNCAADSGAYVLTLTADGSACSISVEGGGETLYSLDADAGRSAA